MNCRDYEALQRANINDISNIKKERGMNNMIAKRIKINIQNAIENFLLTLQF